MIAVAAVLFGVSAGTAPAIGAASVPVSPSPAGPSPAWWSHNTCRGVFDGPPRGSLVKTTSAGPSGGSVLPGQKITVTLTWRPGDFSGQRPFLTEDCVEIGSRISTALSQVHVPGPNGGTDTFTYTVPPEGTGGQPICDRAVVSGSFDPWGNWGQGQGNGKGGTWGSVRSNDDKGSGNDGGGQGWGWGKDGPEKSAILCYYTLPAATPEASNVLFLPASGLLVVGGALIVVRRRRLNAVRLPL
jgi:hypothetical protein